MHSWASKKDPEAPFSALCVGCIKVFTGFRVVASVLRGARIRWSSSGVYGGWDHHAERM